ncbi:MAG: hypothetical protein ACLFSY_04835 [Desulfonatronovibrionaceae bacterium]
MKSELEKACSAFVQENDYIRFLVAMQGKQMGVFPPSAVGMEDQKRLNGIVRGLSGDCSDYSHVLLSGDKLIYTCFKNGFTFVCVCDSNVSISRVRMEMNIFTEKHCQQSGYLQKITSIFNT